MGLRVETVRASVRGRVGVGVAERDGADDFAMGRAAAARALADLGVPPAEIPTGADRAPIWPADIVGSIGHTRDTGVAVVGWSTDFASIGVDIEAAARRIDAGTARRIRVETEHTGFSDPEMLLALFCAKEATYKALAPLGAARLVFHDVAYSPAEPGVLDGRIVNESVEARVPRSFTARYVTADGFVVASVQIAR